MNIIVNLQVEGLHRWEDAPEEVAFLRDLHRHVFYITLTKKVTHNDRDIEIILFKRSVKRYLNKKYLHMGLLQFGEMSCEMIAQELLARFDLVRCKVLEDNENGAEVWE